MPKVNLSRMTVEALMDLRERVDGLLSERHAELRREWTGQSPSSVAEAVKAEAH
jgi:hypothetical protein